MNSPEVANSTTPSLPKPSGHTKAGRSSTSSRRDSESPSESPASSQAKSTPPKKYQSSGHKTPKSTTNESMKVPPVTGSLRQSSSHAKSDRRSSSSSGHTKAARRASSTPKSSTNLMSSPDLSTSATDSLKSSGHTKAVRRLSQSARDTKLVVHNSSTPKPTTDEPMNASDVFSGDDSLLDPSGHILKSSGHAKATRRLSQSASHTKAVRRASESPHSAATAATESPTTSPPATPTPPKQYPMSSASAAKFAREVKVLTETVQALANKLKRRDKEVQDLKETAQRHGEVSRQLESTEERLVEATIENKSMATEVRGLKSTLEQQGMERYEANNAAPAPVNSGKKMIDPEEHRKVRSERDSAMSKAGAMAMTLAECRAETDELRDQLAAVTAQLEDANNSDAPHSPGVCPPTPGVCPPTTRSSMAKGLSLRNLMMPMTPGGNVSKKMGNMWGNRSTHGGGNK
jgi:hypothetical protein